MTKLEEYRKKRQEKFSERFTHLNDSNSEGGYDAKPYVIDFISETEEGMIEIFRGLVGEDVPENINMPTNREMGVRVIKAINQERQRIREQLPSKIN